MHNDQQMWHHVSEDIQLNNTRPLTPFGQLKQIRQDLGPVFPLQINLPLI